MALRGRVDVKLEFVYKLVKWCCQLLTTFRSRGMPLITKWERSEKGLFLIPRTNEMVHESLVEETV